MGQKSNPEEFHQQLVGEMKVLSRSYVRVFLLPSYVGIITSHFKDSCELTSRMEWDKLFFPFLAQVEWMISCEKLFIIAGNGLAISGKAPRK